MLKSLHITNIALIPSASITFEAGFNILTGETGAGKTALTHALALLLGQKPDAKMIRAGCERAAVEAAFEIDHLPQVLEFLRENGLDYQSDEGLIIRRELFLAGKSKSFIGSTLVSSSLIQQLSHLLIEIASQNSTTTLREPLEQLKMVDLFGGYAPLLARFAEQYKSYLEKERCLAQMEAESHDAQDKLDLYRYQFEEIQKLGLIEGEEETLHEEYRSLSDLNERASRLGEIQARLDAIPSLQHPLSALARLGDHPKIQEIAQLLSSASSELAEASYALSSLIDETALDPERFDTIENRLSAINQLKKKYGDIAQKSSDLQAKIAHLDSLSAKQESLRIESAAIQRELDALSLQLRQQRQASAASMAEILTASLHALNLPDARLLIELKPAKRSVLGDDLVDFYLAANPGEPPAAVRDRVSGGELSRVFFALKLLFADRENLPIIIFDEVDANIGGKTATRVGQELKKLGHFRQVIAITHFPQVAAEAQHHLVAEKQVIEGRTITLIRKLTGDEKKVELLRMLGGESSSPQNSDLSFCGG